MKLIRELRAEIDRLKVLLQAHGQVGCNQRHTGEIPYQPVEYLTGDRHCHPTLG